MVQPPSESTLEWCRKLLTGEHEVLVFSPKEDSRRLEEVGLLPGLGHLGCKPSTTVTIRTLIVRVLIDEIESHPHHIIISSNHIFIMF